MQVAVFVGDRETGNAYCFSCGVDMHLAGVKLEQIIEQRFYDRDPRCVPQCSKCGDIIPLVNLSVERR